MQSYCMWNMFFKIRNNDHQIAGGQYFGLGVKILFPLQHLEYIIKKEPGLGSKIWESENNLVSFAFQRYQLGRV